MARNLASMLDSSMDRDRTPIKDGHIRTWLARKLLYRSGIEYSPEVSNIGSQLVKIQKQAGKIGLGKHLHPSLRVYDPSSNANQPDPTAFGVNLDMPTGAKTSGGSIIGLTTPKGYRYFVNAITPNPTTHVETFVFPPEDPKAAVPEAVVSLVLLAQEALRSPAIMSQPLYNGGELD